MLPRFLRISKTTATSTIATTATTTIIKVVVSKPVCPELSVGFVVPVPVGVGVFEVLGVEVGLVVVTGLLIVLWTRVE